MVGMMDRLLLTVAVALSALGSVRAQTYWSKDVGGPGNDHVADVKTDAAGNIYATGEFSGSITFGGSTYLSQGSIDMFLAKLTPAGQVVWFVQGGGPGIDRGIKLAVRGGQVAVVGEFTQTATFQGQSLTSAGGADIFLAVHDAATGQQQWIASGGGPLASDRPYGVAISPSGQVTMAGEFSGTVNIGGTVMTSMPDPITAVPSVDVFIASYSAAGAPLWARQGAAKYTDRAIDLVTDPAGNIYVTGQYSDTIQFAASYPNAMYNATFLLKLDGGGNEQWFRRTGGATYNEVRDMQWSSANDLLLVGDLRGTMIFLDSVPDFISSVDAYAYYLLRVNGNGELVADTVVTSANEVSGRALDERNGMITVLGQFKCQFTSMVDSAHAGLWMATGIQDLFITQHYMDSLYVIKEAQQFGGRQEKLAGQVATLLDGSPIFCGSFEDMLVFPCMNDFSADLASTFAPWDLMAPNTAGFCGNSYYGAFAADTSNGLKDGFIAHGLVPGRAPYDWWDRSQDNCSFLPHMLCLGQGEMAYACPDTVEFCGPGIIGIKPEFSFSINQHNHFIGPELDFLWNTGATTDSLAVTASGTYWVTCTAINGCWQWTDTIVVLVHPFPPQPLLSDDVVVATNSPNQYFIDICDPQQVWLWCSNADTASTFYWTTSGASLYNDSILVDTSGYYHFIMVNEFGCSRYNQITLTDHPHAPIPEVEVSLAITYPQDVDQNDTLNLCPDMDRTVRVVPIFTLNGAPYSFPVTDPPSFQFGFTVNGILSVLDFPGYESGFMVYGDQWYVDEASMFITNAPCGTDTLWLPTVVSDSIYVHVFPAVNVNIALTGPSVIYPGDTAQLVADCPNCDQVSWLGMGIMATNGDTVWTGGGDFTATGFALDTNGCSFSHTAFIHVSYPGVPELDVLPSDGVICPDSSALIFTSAEGSYTWFGPQGEIAVNNDSIVISIPGEYYLSLVDPNGCHLTSDPILITGYSTPYLNVLPDGVICMGEDPVLLQVVTTGYSSLAWGAPLSGNSLTQTVSQPGTYSCTVQACGITTELSTEIIVGAAHAEVVDPGPFSICPGDTLQLAATGGQAVYIWDPGQAVGDSLVVTQAGVYTLTALDGNGCSDTAAAVVVTEHDFGGPLGNLDQTGCSGTPVQLQADAPGNYTWYTDSALTNELATGPVLDLGSPTDSMVVYLVRSDSVCTGSPVGVAVNVVDPPAAVLYGGTGMVCVGTEVQLVANVSPPFQAYWTTPAGEALGDTLVMDPVAVSDAGWYVVAATSSGCMGLADSLLLAVVEPAVLDLGPDTVFCGGDSLLFTVPAGFVDPVWQQADSSTTFTTDQTGSVTLQATDMNGCLVQDEVQVVEIFPDLPVTGGEVTICLGEDVLLLAAGSGNLSWYADSLLQVLLASGDSVTITAPLDSLTLYVLQEQFGCTTGPVTIHVNVVPEPVNITLAGTEPFCIGGMGTLTASGPPGLEGAWSTPSGYFIGTSLTLDPVQATDQGWYTMVPSLAGCIGAPDSIFVSVHQPVPLNLGPDTLFCAGGLFTLMLPAGFSDPVWSTGATGQSITIAQGGVYSVAATDTNGCPVGDIILINAVDCTPVMPNVFSPNGDGTNDVFAPGAVGAVEADVQIYDRWGKLVHSGDLLKQPWNGTDDRTNEPVPNGTYYYVLRLVDSSREGRELSGYFTVLR